MLPTELTFVPICEPEARVAAACITALFVIAGLPARVQFLIRTFIHIC